MIVNGGVGSPRPTGSSYVGPDDLIRPSMQLKSAVCICKQRIFHISLLPSRALVRVASSANSRWLPTGMPQASRVTLTPKGLSRRDRYMAVASPSVSGLVAIITSSILPFATRSTSWLMCRSSGPTWFMGEITP